MQYGGTEFRLGDKVMQIKNNYDLKWKSYDKAGRFLNKGMGVFNGDSGIVTGIDRKSRTLTVVFDDSKRAVYDDTQLDELELAYAVTIHKSQGSEYPVVILPISMSQVSMLQKRLLYTGVTRAKKLLIIVGSKEALEYAVKNDMVEERKTGLKDRLIAMMERGGK